MFPIEEYANGLRWMEEGGGFGGAADEGSVDDGGDQDSRAGSRPMTPGGMPMPLHVSGAYAPRSHPEGLETNFFVGSV